MHIGRRVVNEEVVGHGSLGVGGAVLSGPVHVFTVQGGLGVWEMEVGDLKALSVAKDRHAASGDVNGWVEGVKIADHEFSGLHSGEEDGGEARVVAVQVAVEMRHRGKRESRVRAESRQAPRAQRGESTSRDTSCLQVEAELRRWVCFGLGPLHLVTRVGNDHHSTQSPHR